MITQRKQKQLIAKSLKPTFVGFLIMFKKIRANKVTSFFVFGGLAYLLWVFIYRVYIDPHTLFDEKVISSVARSGGFVLELIGYETQVRTDDVDMQILGIQGGDPIWIGVPCNGVTLMALFTIFITFFPGPTKTKLWFIPLGILIIHVSNILRVSALALVNRYYPQYLDFNHTYTFTFTVYSIIFILWLVWANKYSGIKQKKDA